MHKKHKLHKLHSIPIGLCKNRYLVSYSIPLSCMVVLLLVMGMSIGTWSNYSDVVHAEEGISTHIDVAHPTIAMDVSRNTSDGYGNEVAGQVTTAPGAGTAYRSHKVTVTGSDIQDYQLTISGPSELTSSSGASTVVSGAGGKTGEEMSNSNSNIWGYAWGEDKDEVTGMVYNTMTDAGSNLDCTSPSSDYKVNCERKLVFGANFANNAAGGTYTAEVQLSLVATPHLVGQAWTNDEGFSLDAGIDDMQDIDKVDGGFCRADIPSGSTITLRDSRGGVENLYKIMKMPDGTCWMVENLRLKGSTKITPEDSDVNSSYTLPANASVNSNTMNWGTDSDKDYMAEGSPDMKIYNNSTGWKEAYGNYYSWCAATAMSCKENRTGNAIVNTDAAESICPKNWKLPVGTTGVGSFQSLYNNYPNNTSNTYWLTNQTVPYNSATSGTSANGYNGKRFGNNAAAALFLAAGDVLSDGLTGANSFGYYWSRRAYSDTSNAYYLSFDPGAVYPQGNNVRLLGSSVRCVADEGEGIWTKPDNTVFSTGLKTMQSITKENFSDKYCANTTAANALVPVESTINLKDSRDGNIYTIVKLKDGKCWMQDNLALPGGTKLTSSDSDVNSDWTLPASAISWDTDNYQAVQMKNGTSGMTVSSSNPGDGNGWQSNYGNYYSWCAATAESCKTNRTGSAITSGTAAESICPKNWHLPTGGGSGTSGTGEFGVLNGLNFTTAQQDPYRFPAAGHVGANAQLYLPGTYGYYWSSTPVSYGNYAYNLYFNSRNFAPGTDNNARYIGYSVRCVAD